MYQAICFDTVFHPNCTLVVFPSISGQNSQTYHPVHIIETTCTSNTGGCNETPTDDYLSSLPYLECIGASTSTTLAADE